MTQTSQPYSSVMAKMMCFEEAVVGDGPRVMPRARCPLGLTPLATRAQDILLVHVRGTAELSSVTS